MSKFRRMLMAMYSESGSSTCVVEGKLILVYESNTYLTTNYVGDDLHGIWVKPSGNSDTQEYKYQFSISGGNTQIYEGTKKGAMMIGMCGNLGDEYAPSYCDILYPLDLSSNNPLYIDFKVSSKEPFTLTLPSCGYTDTTNSKNPVEYTFNANQLYSVSKITSDVKIDEAYYWKG